MGEAGEEEREGAEGAREGREEAGEEGEAVSCPQIEHLWRAAYPEMNVFDSVIVRAYEVPASESARGRSFWRAEASCGGLSLNHPGATAQEALESLGAELVRVKLARCDDGPHRLSTAARDTLEDEGIDPRAVIDSAAWGYDHAGVCEWVVACPAGEVARLSSELSRAPVAIETITLVPVRMARGAGATRVEWIEWMVRE